VPRAVIISAFLGDRLYFVEAREPGGARACGLILGVSAEFAGGAAWHRRAAHGGGLHRARCSCRGPPEAAELTPHKYPNLIRPFMIGDAA